MFALCGMDVLDDELAIERVGSNFIASKLYRNPAIVIDTFLVTMSSDRRHALVQFMVGGGGGEMLMIKTAPGWSVAFRGAGEMSAEMIEGAGVSHADAAKLLAPCSKERRQSIPILADLRSRFSNHIHDGPNAGAPTPGVLLCRS
jgi:hypothetical protein